MEITRNCFHHPDRETGRACTRCGRPACPDCLIQASVGSQCFECVKAAAPSRAQRVSQVLSLRRPTVTYSILAITVAAYLLIALHDAGLNRFETRWLRELAVFGPAVHDGEWWRLFTNSLVHYSVVHIAFNMYALFLVGTVLEPAAGHVRFGMLYVVSVLGGAFGALLLDPHSFTGGASGGVFGIAAGATLVMHRQGVRFMDTGFGPILIFNLALTFLWPGISIGGHLGGMAAGLLATESMLQARRIGRPQLGVLGAALVGAAAVTGGLLAAAQ